MNLYIHVPFCAQRCGYCDFYTQTKLGLRVLYLRALFQELEARRSELSSDEQLEHIYLGGGTPSLLSPAELESLFAHIWRLYPVRSGAEITLEANPDDMTAEYARALGELPINRVSMGVQSFHDDELHLLNRRHSAAQVYDAVDRLREVGIDELSLDLIYGLPGQTLPKWRDNLDRIISIDVPHISAYHLIYEEGTPMARALERGRIKAVDEELSLDMFRCLVDELGRSGYEHYEISNFARPGHYARLNTGYWQGVSYIGAGPAAHSYDGRVRSHNDASIEQYAEGWLRGERVCVQETLTPLEQRNEYLMTRLRTMWGLSPREMGERFGGLVVEGLLSRAVPHVERGNLLHEGETLRLSREGVFVSDAISVDLFE